ncbi:facilitated trehalose transporter Tret1-like [Drosophila montana]|uniref:facilitated trehalose transporter Tret1-like n=1 Tax=Drosophila montana TaxID=40370 RepID=UPI00313CD8E8
MEKPILSGEAYNFSPSIDDWSWACAVFTLGAACMCIPTGILAGAFGRKLVMLILLFPGLLGWALIIAARHTAMLYAGRFVLGACAGGYCVVSPMYTTEIAEVKVRGIMGCFFQLMLVHGVLFSFIVGAFLKPLPVNIVIGSLPIVWFIFIIWLPESPVYLVQKGKPERAMKGLKSLRKTDADINSEMAAFEAESKKEKIMLRNAMLRKTTIRGLIIAVLLMMLQQFTGINGIVFYVTGIFDKAGTGLSPSNCTIITGVVQIITTFLSTLIIDRVGRKVLLLISAFLMLIANLTMGFFFKFLTDKNIGWLSILAIALFFIGFAMGFGPICWLVMAELFAEDVKPICASIVGTSAWLFGFVVAKMFPILVREFGSAVTFWVFAFFSILACFFVIFFVPETKGKTLEEIQGLLS